jgi:Family of unknown function (DUF6328)
VAEDKKDRIDRELIELLNELRVVLPGVQVLFAFLLTVPFTQRFETVTEGQRAVYFGSFICTALATALFIAPMAYHRLRFRERDKERMLFTANRLAISGTVLLVMAIAGAVYLITDLLYHVTAASLVTAAVTAWFTWFWYGLPLTRKARDEDAPSGDGQ